MEAYRGDTAIKETTEGSRCIQGPGWYTNGRSHTTMKWGVDRTEKDCYT